MKKIFSRTNHFTRTRTFATHILKDTRTAQDLDANEIRRLDDIDFVWERKDPKNPYDDHAINSYVPFTPGWWRERRDRLTKYLYNTTGATRVSSLDKSFDEKYMANYAFTIFRQLNSGIILGDEEYIKGAVIPSFASKIGVIFGTAPLVMDKKFTFENEAPLQTPFSGRITKLLEKPTLCAAEPIWVSRQDSNLSFGQVVFHILTEQTLVYPEDELITQYYKQNKTYNLHRKRPRSIPKANFWKKAIASSGKTYYYNDSTGETTWKKPRGIGEDQTRYDPATGTLGFGRVVKHISPHSCVVENFLVLQKPFFRPSSNWLLSSF